MTKWQTDLKCRRAGNQSDSGQTVDKPGQQIDSVSRQNQATDRLSKDHSSRRPTQATNRQTLQQTYPAVDRSCSRQILQQKFSSSR